MFTCLFYLVGKKPDATHVIHTGPMSVKVSDVVVTIDENLPLIKKETQITIDHVSYFSANMGDLSIDATG